MKVKFHHILIIMIIVCCSISAVAAADNETSAISDISDSHSIAVENNFLGSANLQSTSEDQPNETFTSNPAPPSSPTGDNIFGIVDLGSNVLSLNIYAEDHGIIDSILYEGRDSVTAKYKQDNKLTQEGIDELISVFDDYDKIMNSRNVTVKYFFGTASLRGIDNCDEVVAAVKNRLGIDLHVLSGEDESRVGFKAVKYTDLKDDDAVLIDIGGGSTEITIIVNRTPIFMESIPFGSLVAYNEYVHDTFPNESEILDIQDRVNMELDSISAGDYGEFAALYGNGGTLYTFKKLLIYWDEIDSDTYVIDASLIDSSLARLLENTTETYRMISEVDAKRINTLMPGIVIAKAIRDYFDANHMHFCKSPLEVGVVYELIENMTRDSPSEDVDNDTASDNTTNQSVHVNAKTAETILEKHSTGISPLMAILSCLAILVTSGYRKRK